MAIEQKDPKDSKQYCQVLALGHDTAVVHMNSQLQLQKAKPVKNFRKEWAGTSEGLPRQRCLQLYCWEAKDKQSLRLTLSQDRQTDRQIRQRKTPSVNIWPPHTHGSMPAYFTHIYTRNFKTKTKEKTGQENRKKVKGEGKNPSQIFLQSFCKIKDFDYEDLRNKM